MNNPETTRDLALSRDQIGFLPAMADNAASIEKKRRDELPPFRSLARIQDIWMTPEELEDMVIAKTGFVVDALLEGKLLRDDGTMAAAREKLVQSLERLKIRKLEHGWMIPRSDLNAVISFE